MGSVVPSEAVLDDGNARVLRPERGDAALRRTRLTGGRVSSRTLKGVLLVAVLAIGAGVAYLGFGPAPEQVKPAEPVPQVQQPAEPASSGLIEPVIRYPIVPELAVVEAPAEAAVVPPPELAGSDDRVAAEFGSSFGGGLGELVVVKDLVRRIVVTVDNLPGERLPLSRSPVRKAEGGFIVNEQDGARSIAADNEARYLPYVLFAEQADMRMLVSAYRRLYPLFQAAYDELGYPSAYFNDRLVVVIDHMLAAPEVAGPIRLIQPKVRYRFEDPELEALSAGQKVMVRMGVDNARRIKAKLRELRQGLTAGAPAR